MKISSFLKSIFINLKPITLSLAIKHALHQYITALLLERIQTSSKALEDIIEARDNESKSSAGDKYETGRAMMQISQQQQEVQLHSARTLLQQLQNLKNEKQTTRANIASLVYTNQGIFYLSIALGEVHFQDQSYLIVSMASPIAQLFKDKKVGDAMSFRGKEYQIQEIF